MSNGGWGEVGSIAHRVELGVGLDIFCELNYNRFVRRLLQSITGIVLVLVSPASPENAIRVCLLRIAVLSSEALRMVAPLIAAFEAAMMVKSLPVIPSNTSLVDVSVYLKNIVSNIHVCD